MFKGGNTPELHYLMKGEFEYVHMSGRGFTRDPNMAWLGTKKQGHNLMAANPKEYKDNQLIFIFVRKGIHRKPFWRYGG